MMEMVPWERYENAIEMIGRQTQRNQELRNIIEAKDREILKLVHENDMLEARILYPRYLK